MALANKKISFKQGTQASLDTLIENGTATEGVIYLTSDTHKLYVGEKESGEKVVPVSLNYQDIFKVDKISNLPKYQDDDGIHEELVGRFYYAEAENVFCILSSKKEWIQINPDTDTYLSENAESIEIEELGTDKKAVKSTLTIKDAKGHTASGEQVLRGGTNVEIIKNDNGEIEISSSFVNDDTKYKMQVASIKVGETTTYQPIVQLQTEGQSVDAGKVEFSANLDKSTSKNPLGEFEVTATDGKIEYVLKPADMYNNGVSVTSGERVVINSADEDVDTAKQGFLFAVKDGAGTQQASINPKIKIGGTQSKEVVFIRENLSDSQSSVATLDVYTQAEVDKKIENALASADAMTFKGVIGLADSENYIPSTNVTSLQAGDTYKVGEVGLYWGFVCNVGDLLIAQRDNTNADDKNAWYRVEAGEAQVIGGNISPTTNLISIFDDKLADNAKVLAALKLVGGEHINISSAAQGTDTQSNGSTLVTTIKHATVETAKKEKETQTQTPDTSLTITAIKELKTDGYGHITEYVPEEITLTDTDTHNHITGIEQTVKSYEEEELVKGFETIPSINTSDGDTVTHSKSLQVKSDTLAFKVTNNGQGAAADQVEINLVWGSF